MTNYQKLINYQKDYPELTFQNIGFETLSNEIKERHKEQIQEISEILKTEIEGFVEFNNFRLRKDDTFDVRCQYRWDRHFTGVGYFKIEWFKEEIEEHD